MRLSTLCLVIAIIAGNSSAHPREANSPPGVPQDQPVPLSSALQAMGTDYDRFFTIEESLPDDGMSLLLRSRPVVRPGKKFGLIRELEELRRTVPGFTYYVSRREPRVIHVIDAALARRKDYGMSAVVPRIDFTGTLMALTSAIEMQGIPVAPSLVHDADTFPFLDFSTKVKVSARRMSVRDVLTDFIPLRGHSSRILWFAETKAGQKEKTLVEFRG
jgi:hypothetical protein